MMRIITGKAKGVRLASLPGDATRPTSERVKEAIFSSLQFDLEGRRALDLFAGSGQLGLEALSRAAPPPAPSSTPRRRRSRSSRKTPAKPAFSPIANTSSATTAVICARRARAKGSP